MKPDFFILNRKNLTALLRGGIVVLTAYTAMQRNNDASFKFEQESNFWYLTGINKPDWWLIIDGVRNKSWLVSPEISQSHQIFEGSLLPDEAKSISGVDYVISRDEATSLLRDLAKKHTVVYSLGDQPHAEYFDFHLNPVIKQMTQTLERTFNTVRDCRGDLASLRAIKQPGEIVAIKKAVKLTAGAFADIKQKLSSMHFEYEVEAEFSYYFRKNGADGHAYEPIVAAGKNACTLHYVDNNGRLKKNDLLLLDIGAKIDGYSADLTRTYALGAPTKRQQDLHRVLEYAQRNIVDLLKPGLSIAEYYKMVDSIMKNALLELGIINSISDETGYRKYFPHSIGHGLGVDVHDSLGRNTKFLPGMVLTVEPGIYIPEEGLGVRLEDDVLITESGHSNLSSTLSTSL